MEIYYLHLDDEQKGPFTIGQLQEMWKAGIITMKTPFWNKVIGEWKMLDSILELLEPSNVELFAQCNSNSIAQAP